MTKFSVNFDVIIGLVTALSLPLLDTCLGQYSHLRP